MNDLYLQHHGIQGQKWGVRRYQNSDGTLTAEGRARKASPKIKSGTKLSLSPEQKAKIKKAAKIGVTAAGTGLAIYGTYKVSKFVGPARTKAGVQAIQAMYKASEMGKSAAKTIGKATKDSAKNFVQSIPNGMVDMGGKMGKVVGGGIMALAIKELADIAVGEDVSKIVLNAYNSQQKKDAKIKSPND